MNISKINSINFGVIRKSAAKTAIIQARGNVAALKKLEYEIEKQKDNNRYDIISPMEYQFYIYSSPHLYEVVKRGESSSLDGMQFTTLEAASEYATSWNKIDESWEYKAEIAKRKKSAFDSYAQRLLDKCEE